MATWPPIASKSKMRIIVGGFLGLLPAGGVTWDYLQYPLGFLELGHDVFYIEDTRLWPVFQSENGGSTPIAHLAQVMASMGMKDRWSYRDEFSGEWLGMSESRVQEVLQTADLLVNVSCATALSEAYMKIPLRALIDSDPMFTQVQYLQDRGILSEQTGIRAQVDGHTHHCTFAENIGAIDCRIPATGHHWLPTRQPVCLSQWQESAPVTSENSREAFTTVMNWSAAREMEFGGEQWGQKNREFEAFLDLPRHVRPIRLAVALARRLDVPFPAAAARRAGWELLDPSNCVSDWQDYRRFLYSSLGEFSVAKHSYVKARTGWFSCRSACYLASGRPVITQDTGWSQYLPSGEGLLAFTTPDQAAHALREVHERPAKHGTAARRIAEEFFDSHKVLGDLLTAVGA